MIAIPLGEFQVSAQDPKTQVPDSNAKDDLDEDTMSERGAVWPRTRLSPEWRDFLEQYPWSISDPGPSPLLTPEVSDKKYSASSPLLNPQLDYRLLGTRQNDTEQPPQCFGTSIRPNSETKFRSKVFPRLKWVFILLNVVFEGLQAALSQEANQNKLPRKFYHKLSIGTSSICLIMSLVEAFHEGRINHVVWRNRGGCCWFYYPETQGRLFGTFSLYFGIICSTVQLFVNLIEKVTRKNIVKFDYVPLLLSVCYLGAAVIAPREKAASLAVVKCRAHGYITAEATSVDLDGHISQVFECPECQLENNC